MATRRPSAPALRPLVDELQARRDRARAGGGEERAARLRAAGRLTARERVALLVDAGSFTELGLHGGPHHAERALDGREAPADGVVTGHGRVDGRPVAVAATDFTVMAGSLGATGELKLGRLRELALTRRMPMVWLLDTAGARIQESPGALFAGTGTFLREQARMRGVVPQIAAILGPCPGSTAYIAGLADFVPMVAGHAALALAGPHLVRAATGEAVGQEELGGARMHCRVSGVGDLEVRDDATCLAAVRTFLGYLPSHRDEPPPRRPAADPPDRAEEALLDLFPADGGEPYDMYELVRQVVDDGEWLDLKPEWGRAVITCLARFGGRPVGLVASQPLHDDGVLDNDAADKAARFVSLCDAFGLPLVFLVDVPGFAVGADAEAAGVIRHGARLVEAVAAAEVPKVTVVVRRAYGAGYYAMGGRAFDPDLLVAWPTAEIALMAPEDTVEIAFGAEVARGAEGEARRGELVAAYRELADVYVAAENALVDDVIDPRETRQTIIRALDETGGRPRRRGPGPAPE
jgi:acetyl-CoA carboxylase carboxyltransferase component